MGFYRFNVANNGGRKIREMLFVYPANFLISLSAMNFYNFYLSTFLFSFNRIFTRVVRTKYHRNKIFLTVMRQWNYPLLQLHTKFPQIFASLTR